MIDREKYLLWAKMAPYKNKLAKTVGIIYNALSETDGNWMLSFSSGKDSVVLLDLLIKCGWNGCGFQAIYSKFESPYEILELTEYYNKKYNINIESIKCYGATDVWDDVGYMFLHPISKLEKLLAKESAIDFKNKSTEYMKKNNSHNLFLGLRKDESKSRRISLSIKGNLYQTKIREGWTCCPIANWSSNDIWAYIVSNDLKYLKVYDIPHHDAGRIRNELTLLYTPTLLLHGELLQYRLAYPHLFNELCDKYPEIRQYI